MISTGQPFQDVCTKPPKWFRRVKELFRARVAQRHIRPCRCASSARPWGAFYPSAPVPAPPAVAAAAARAYPKVPVAAIPARRGYHLAGAGHRLAAAAAADRPAGSSAAAPGRPGLPAIPAAIPVDLAHRFAAADPAAVADPAGSARGVVVAAVVRDD